MARSSGPADGQERAARARLDDPILTFSPTFACQCPRALKVLVTATVVGLLTGFLGVGGGFLVVPALLLALSLPARYAVGTSLVVITLTSAAALVVRAGVGVAPEWGVVLPLTAAAALGGLCGARLADRTDTSGSRSPSRSSCSASPSTPPCAPCRPSSDHVPVPELRRTSTP